MKKRYFAKLFIIVMTLCTGAKVLGAEAELLLGTEAPLSVSIEKTASSVEATTIDVATGVNNGSILQSVFTLQTNGTDDDYDLILSSAIQISGGATSGYANIGGKTVLMFANIENLPTESDISNLRSSGTQNYNVIAYPIVMTTSSPMTSEYYADYSTYGECIVIKLNGATTGSVKQLVKATPLVNTYRIGHDTAGTYKAIVTFTAISKL